MVTDDLDDEATDLGPCCVCESTIAVHSIVMLHQKAPIAGRGWGCVVCGLASDGALAVVCDRCADNLEPAEPIEMHLRFACRGYPAADGRVPIATLTGTHDHDLSQHPVGDYAVEYGIDA